MGNKASGKKKTLTDSTGTVKRRRDEPREPRKEKIPKTEPTTREIVAKFKPSSKGALQEPWDFPEELVLRWLMFVDPKNASAMACVSQLWLHNIQMQKYWEIVAKRQLSLWFEYDSVPSDWLQYYILCTQASRDRNHWPFTTDFDVTGAGPMVVTHPQTDLKIMVKKVGDRQSWKGRPGYAHRARVFGVFQYKKTNWLAQSFVEGLVVNGKHPLVEKLKQPKITETLCFALLDPEAGFSETDLSIHLHNVILTTCGIPCFFNDVSRLLVTLAASHKKKPPPTVTTAPPVPCSNSGTGSEWSGGSVDSGGSPDSDCTGTEEYTGVDPSGTDSSWGGTGTEEASVDPCFNKRFHSVSILNLVLELNGLSPIKFEAAIQEKYDEVPFNDKRNETCKKLFLDYCVSVLPQYSKRFHEFFRRALDAGGSSPQTVYTPLQLISLQTLLKHADPSYQCIRKLLEDQPMEKVVLGPTSGTVKVLRDNDFVSVDTCPPPRGPFNAKLHNEFLTSQECDMLMTMIDAGTWTQDREAKRVQIYGYNYIDPSLGVIPLPKAFGFLIEKLKAHGYGEYDQLIVSEYLPGIGVVGHVDRFFWGDSIIGPVEKKSFHLCSGSLYQLSGVSRYLYQHGIPASSISARRVSLTFRNLASDQVALPAAAFQKFKFAGCQASPF